MVPDRVACRLLHSDHFRMSERELSENEEGRLHVVVRKHLQQALGLSGDRPIVEREVDRRTAYLGRLDSRNLGHRGGLCGG
jgi:hypothetical protein